MLTLRLPETEGWDPVKEEFISIPSQTIKMEHSLLSISKWESKWKKPYLINESKTNEEILDYLSCMVVYPEDLDPIIFQIMDSKYIDQIANYINDPMTATTISNRKNGPSRKIITSEVIYYWMTALNIPFECEKWHLNRLMMLIEVCGIESSPKKKMSKKEILDRNRALNASRRARMH